jgi:hypothetical protein
MRNLYPAPAMTIANMRALGVTSIGVTCRCGREAIVDDFWLARNDRNSGASWSAEMLGMRRTAD